MTTNPNMISLGEIGVAARNTTFEATYTPYTAQPKLLGAGFSAQQPAFKGISFLMVPDLGT